MTTIQFSRANEIISKMSKVENEISDLYNSELKVNAFPDSKEFTIFDIKISKSQLKSIIKYNRELLNNKKENLRQILSTI